MKARKLLLASISVFIIGLFITANCNALTTHTVEYPSTVKLGESFTINIVFDYELEFNCLYGISIWFFWMVNDEVASSWTTGLTKNIYNLENHPRPTNVSWTFDTTVFAHSSLETDDVIQFRIKYKTGHETNSIIYFEGIIMTPTYEITIGETPTEKTNAVSIIISSILILSAALIKRNKRVELK